MANDDFRSPVVIPTPTLPAHPATKAYVDAAVAAGGGGGTGTLRGATDYDNSVAPTDGQVIAWLGSSSKYRPLTLTPTLIGAVSLTASESIGGQKTVPSGSGNQWIFNQPPQIAVGTAANHAVRRDDARVTADQAATQASVRTLGTGALQAAAGDHLHAGVYALAAHNHDGSYATLGHSHSGFAATSHSHNPPDVGLVANNLGSFANGSTITVIPNRSSVYRATVTGAAVTLAMNGTTDMEVVNIEILASAATVMTFAAALFETGGIPASVSIPINKRWFGVLRYVTSVGWFVLASSVQN